MRGGSAGGVEIDAIYQTEVGAVTAEAADHGAIAATKLKHAKPFERVDTVAFEESQERLVAGFVDVAIGVAEMSVQRFVVTGYWWG